MEDDVRIYFGTSDPGATDVGWDETFVFDVSDIVEGQAFSTNVTGLLYGQEHYYRVYATNEHGAAWSDLAGPFTTLPPPSGPVSIPPNEHGGRLRLASGVYSYDKTGEDTIVGNSGGGGVNRDIMFILFELPQRPADGFDDSDTSFSVSLSGDNGDRGNQVVDLWAVGYVPAAEIADVGTNLENPSVTDVDDFWLYDEENETKNGWNLNSANTVKVWGEFADQDTSFGILTSTPPANAALTDFVNDLYTHHGASAGDYLVLRITIHPHRHVGRFIFDGANAADESVRPSLTLSGASAFHVNATSATNITGTTADLQGTLDAPDSVFTVTAYWSTNSLDETTWAAEHDGYLPVGTFTNQVGYALTAPATGLLAGTEYFYTFSASNAVTNIWAENANFETEPPLELVALNPADGAMDVSITIAPSMTFGEDAQKGSGMIEIRAAWNDTLVEGIDVSSGQVSIDGGVVTITLSQDLAYSRTYSVVVPTGAFEADSEAADRPVSAAIPRGAWQFTTRAAPGDGEGSVFRFR